MNIYIDTMQAQDWNFVSEIYRQGIDTGNATFETGVPSWESWNSCHLEECRFVARNGNRVVGWSALSPVSQRCVYGGVAEVSVYVAKNVWGEGIGKLLMEALIQSSEEESIWTLQAGIFPENQASISLHKKFGFREIGFREKIGCMNGVWRDIVLLERRSKTVGI